MPHIEQSLNGVTIFVVAARAGSFTTAADRLGITKSAVGKSIARLEDRLGCKLFHRTTRRLSLTVDGEAYFASCANAVDEIMAAEVALTSRKQTPSGRLRIDLPVAYGRSIVLPVLLDIVNQNPALQLTISFTDHLIDPIEEGVDLLIRFGELKDSSGLVARRLTTQQQIICASPGYIKRWGKPESLESLYEHKCIVGFRRGQPLGWTGLDDNGQLIRIVPPATHEVGDGDAIVEMAIQGMGLCQMPDSLVSQHLKCGRLVPVLESLSCRQVEINAVSPKTRHLLPKVRHVVDELVTRAQRGELG